MVELDEEAIQALFLKHDLPEVSAKELETGTYTNMEIAEAAGSIKVLEQVLGSLPRGGGRASRRSILSFWVDSRRA